MRFVPHLHSSVKEQIRTLAETLKSTEEQPRFSDEERGQIYERIVFFTHTTHRERLSVACVAANGDFPAVSYADSYVYATFAQAVVYEADTVAGLKEIAIQQEPLFDFAVLPEEDAARYEAFEKTFSMLAGNTVADVIADSDYPQLKARESRKTVNAETLRAGMIRPPAADAGNIGIQLRSTAEWGMALRLLRNATNLNYLMIEGTLSLPMVGQVSTSLFYEYLKRLCCVEATRRQIGMLALTKSHGLTTTEPLEEIVREKASQRVGGTDEHWFLRLPIPGIDRWNSSLARGRRLPPAGAVTYLFRLHRNSPLMRLDVDLNYWREVIQGQTAAQTQKSEQRLFEDLDYASHDQRSYGAPYPMYSVNQRVTLTKAERTALRKQIIDAAVKAGMKRSLFRETSLYSGSEQE